MGDAPESIEALRRRIEILEEENAALAEGEEDAFLLGQVAAEVRGTEDPAEILRAGLERICVLKDLPLALCVRSDGGGAALLQHYASFTDGPPGPAPAVSRDLFSRADPDGALLEEDACGGAGLGDGTPFAFRPRAVLAVPWRARGLGDGLFLFADDRDGERLRRSRSLLLRVCELLTGRVDHVALVAELRDATERLQRTAEAKTHDLASRERFLAAVLRTSLDGFWVVRGDRIIDANAAACALTGMSLEELRGTPISRIDAIDSAEDVARRAAEIRVRGWARFLSRHRRKDGELLDVEVTVSYLPEENLQVAFIRDVTEARRSEEARARREAWFRTLIERSTDMILLLDANGRFTFWSASATEQLGWSEAEALAMSAFEMIHPEDAPKLAEAMRSLEGRPGAVASLSARFRNRAGEWRHVEGLGRNLLHDPAVGAVIVNSRDVTALRALEDQVRQSQRLDSIGRLAGGVAHDFNNLLTVILASAEELRDDARAGVPPTRETVDAIRSAGLRARDLTAQLLSLARRQLIAPVSLDLGEVLGQSLTLLRRVLPETVAIAPRVERGLWPVRADASQIAQVLVNLGVNARDAMPGGGRISIELGNVRVTAEEAARRPTLREGEWVRLAVRDEGTGLSPEAQAHLFEPFFTTKPKGQGTGLGLATVYGIVAQAGGLIDVESATGRGASFALYFPRAAAQPAPAAPARAAPGPSAGGAVLVVEDEPLVREATARILQAAGYAVWTASGGAEAIALVRSGARPELLVTDAVMPGMSGRELADELTRLLPGLPILYISGHAEDVVAKSGVLDPGVELLLKPFARAELLDRVEGVLARRRAHA